MRRKSRDKLCVMVLNYFLDSDRNFGYNGFRIYLISKGMKVSYSCRRKGFVTILNTWRNWAFTEPYIHIPKDLAEKILVLGYLP